MQTTMNFLPEIGMYDLFFGLVSESKTSHIGSAKIVTCEKGNDMLSNVKQALLSQFLTRRSKLS